MPSRSGTPFAPPYRSIVFVRDVRSRATVRPRRRFDGEYRAASRHGGLLAVSGGRDHGQTAAQDVGPVAGYEGDEVVTAENLGGAVVAHRHRSQVAERLVKRPASIGVGDL